MLASRRILNDFQPDVLLFTGGYVAVPMALAGSGCLAGAKSPACCMSRISSRAWPSSCWPALPRIIALTAEDSRQYFPARKRMVVTGYPTRPELTGWTREKACQHLGLQAGRFTLLVTGGSNGARSINRALLAILPQLLAEIQVIHITGQLDWAEVEAAHKQLPARSGRKLPRLPYLHEMGAALAAADLVVSRAGASTLGEYPLFGLPAILVPYPHAWRYQKVNADYLVERGAARLIDDAQLPSRPLTGRANLIPRPRNDCSSMRQRDAVAGAPAGRPAPGQPGATNSLRETETTGKVRGRNSMVSLIVVFWMYVILFAIIGAMRGWARELLVAFSVILALFIISVLENFVPFIRNILASNADHPLLGALDDRHRPGILWLPDPQYPSPGLAEPFRPRPAAGYPAGCFPRRAERLPDRWNDLVLPARRKLPLPEHHRATRPGSTVFEVTQRMMAIMPPDVIGRLIGNLLRGGPGLRICSGGIYLNGEASDGVLESAEQLPHVHFIGIGGSGLSAIARLLLESGYTVTGSDRALSPLAQELADAGVRVVAGHSRRERARRGSGRALFRRPR